MAAVWQRKRADVIWIWNARWGLGVCAYHLQAERSGAKARGKVASEGAGGVGALRETRNDFSNAFGVDCQLPAPMANFLGQL